MNTPELLRLEPDEFIAKFYPILEMRDAPGPHYFEVAYDTGDGVYSVNTLITKDIRNDYRAAADHAADHASRHGYSVAYVKRITGTDAGEAYAKGRPTIKLDNTAADHSAEPTQEPVDTPDDYFVRNNETGKLELHFTKAAYMALDEDAKKRIKGDFLWGRASGCWTSRAKTPNLHFAIKTAQALGLHDAGETGERISFADQMADKAARAERRADRYEARSEKAAARGEALQKSINDMHGDIAFFTQPDINTSAGRAFTNRRKRMWEAFEQGFEEFNKSAYWKDRARVARSTAEEKSLSDKGFIMRRIDERKSDIRKLRRSIEEYESYIAALDKGETPRDRFGYEIRSGRESIETQIEAWLDRLEAKVDELCYYRDRLDALGGVTFSRENLHKGDMIVISRWREPVRFLRGGPKNFTYEFTLPHMRYADGSQMIGTADYAEIVRRVDDTEA